MIGRHAGVDDQNRMGDVTVTAKHGAEAASRCSDDAVVRIGRMGKRETND